MLFRSLAVICRARQREIKRGAAPRLRIDPDAAARARDDFFARRQAYAAASYIRAVRPLHGLKNSLKPIALDAHAVIGHRKEPRRSLPCRAHSDHRWHAWAAVLDRIRQQVLEKLIQRL